MSKENQEPKNYSDYAYVGDETITMSVQEFVTIQKALDQAISNGVLAFHPQVVRWYDVKTGKALTKEPTSKQMQEGKVVRYADAEATKNAENMQVTYKANIFPHVFEGREVAMLVHQRMVDDGVAKPLAEVRKAYEERQAKGQMKVQEEAPETVSEPKATTMKVVRDEPNTKE